MVIVRKQFMPYLTGGGCVNTEECPEVIFPTVNDSCICETAVGGVNELYLIPCSEEFTEDNVTSPAWYTGLINADRFG